MAGVFVSHRKCDAVAAEQLAAELRLAGHKVWFDEWEIAPGDSIVGRMNEGLGDASYLILCLSPAGVDSPSYTFLEWRRCNEDATGPDEERLDGGATHEGSPR